ncbi:MAG: NAD(P)-dependent oxidoreductase [Clostridia bacterium]|nr:NAD(P)-dependent oxidoreductase [Clostridia bacterium]
MDRVIIAGADGFIGSHLCRYFASQGLSVYAQVIPNSPLKGRIEGINGVEIVECDLTREDAAKLFPQSPKAFLCLAWAGVSPEGRDSFDLQFSNVELVLKAARLAALIRAEKFILPGSTAEYTDCGGPINGDSCPSPQNAYGAAKVSARYLCRALCRELDLPYIYAVITGIYAADRRDSNVIYYAIRQLLDRKKPSLTALEQLWDYVHIRDVERAFYLIATRGKGGAFYSIGHGDNQPLSRYIEQIRDIIDPDLPLGIGEIPYRDGRRPSSCIDLTALRRDTGFEPSVPFEEGIREVIRAIRMEDEQKSK